MAIFRLLGDALTKKLGAVNTVRAGALLAACGLTAALTTHSAGGALAGFAITGAGCSVIVPLVFAASGRAPSIPRGLGIAMVSGAGYIGFLFGPPLIGFIAQLTSLRAGLSMPVVLCLLAAVFAAAVREQSNA
jgi:MFS family permease